MVSHPDRDRKLISPAVSWSMDRGKCARCMGGPCMWKTNYSALRTWRFAQLRSSTASEHAWLKWKWKWGAFLHLIMSLIIGPAAALSVRPCYNLRRAAALRSICQRNHPVLIMHGQPGREKEGGRPPRLRPRPHRGLRPKN